MQIEKEKPKMLLRESYQTTKRFLHKTLQNLNTFLFGEYQKVQEAVSCSPFSCNKNLKKTSSRSSQADFSDQWESDQDVNLMRKMKGTMSAKELVKEEDNSSGDIVKLGKQSPGNNKHEEGGNEEIKNKRNSSQGSGVLQPSIILGADEGSFALFQKMKELEMVDAADVNHVLDIEEVLHNYSLLTSPIYLDIVDEFFMDMYREFFLPRAPSFRINCSSRRLAAPSFRSNSSSRKLEASSFRTKSSSRRLEAPSFRTNSSSRRLEAPSFHTNSSSRRLGPLKL